MATIKRFEDLESWKRARELAREIWKATQMGTFMRDYKLKDQINSASGSTMDNIAEGFGRGGRSEFVNFLSIAKGSNDETKSQLYRAFDREHLTEETFNSLYNLADEAGKTIHGLIEYLNASEIKGQKFKDRTI
ncbi:MAG: four helix bundle protein [Bacteroidota bacterium]|nr:four helix bundle protein [Bacteroidota bacterium]